MKYKNAKTVLPEPLFRELQQYVQGEMLYVPGDGPQRARWGESNGTREKYRKRNNEILMLYRNGISKEVIAGQYFLSEHSIKKIVQDKRYKDGRHESGKEMNSSFSKYPVL